MSELEEARNTWDIKPIFNLILDKVPEAPNNTDKPFRMQIANLGYDDFVWRLGIGRVYDGTVIVGQQIIIYDNYWNTRKWKIAKLYTTLGLSRVASKAAKCGDIVTIAGIPDIFVWETVWVEWVEPFEAIKVDEPTLTMDFLVNDSPFAWQDGKQVTSRNLIERLEKELETNVWLEIDFEVWENRFAVSGRWELHLSVLIETMRREW
jgi:GTP-binding protein